MKAKVIIDTNIPYIRGSFDKEADVEYLMAKEITPQKVESADILIIRTRTQCNADLLETSNVKFIATATIGTDHIDSDYCEAHNIAWTNAPGCNAESVAQWVGSALAVWAKKHNTSLIGKTIGIVGHGHVGKRVERLARKLGMRVLLNDPLLALEDPDRYVDLDTIATKCDVITFHTPLTRTGRFATYHLADEDFFETIKMRAKKHTPPPYRTSPNLGEECELKWQSSPVTNPKDKISHNLEEKCDNLLIINAARGGIVDEEALLRSRCEWAIDCWEGEPETNNELRNNALIATPHIAGYSADGKLNASQQVIWAVSEFLGITPGEIEGLPEWETTDAEGDELRNLLLKNYDIIKDSESLKAEPERFEWFRNNYPIRRELKI